MNESCSYFIRFDAGYKLKLTTLETWQEIQKCAVCKFKCEIMKSLKAMFLTIFGWKKNLLQLHIENF